ncbi:MAG: S16 family serine protease [Desulfocapsaceae bacterium]
MFFKRKPPKIDRIESPEAKQLGRLDLLRHQVRKTDLPEYVSVQAETELAKLEKIDSISAEYSIGLTYIEMLLALPWFSLTVDNLNIDRAESVFDQCHYGLEDVKNRVLDFLAAKTLRGQATPQMLIVDDESVALSNMDHYFRRHGFEVQTAINGQEALEKVQNGAKFDIVLTDLKMEKMDGLELLDRLNTVAPDTSVIMITGYATIPSAVGALQRGAMHYLSKPVDLEELKTTVDDVLKQQKRIDMAKGPVLCFTGPPGTGKTSIGKTIARVIGREFIRIPMGGLKDEAEIRGHRRTYVGAMPGRIVTEIKRCGFINPCIMLDEIDKVGQDFRGDPASVLLEVLDPEQNASFIDHYLEIPIDLSKIMFITTANEPERLPQPLLDRMEMIEFSGYSVDEKKTIAVNHLIPEQLSENGLGVDDLIFPDKALEKVITDYTLEAGIRGLNREIGKVCRKMARIVLERRFRGFRPEPITLAEADITRFLGPVRFRREAAEGPNAVGVVTALVWTSYGGDIMFIETQRMSGTSQLILTGSLGEVLRESAQTALSYIRSNADTLQVDSNFFEKSDLHIHLPAGAVAKDGPSAGAAICLALISLLTKRQVRRTVGITGELSLTGQILPVGGIREKLLAAARAGVTKVLVPAKNLEDVENLPSDTSNMFSVVPINFLDEAINHIICTPEDQQPSE